MAAGLLNDWAESSEERVQYLEERLETVQADLKATRAVLHDYLEEKGLDKRITLLEKVAKAAQSIDKADRWGTHIHGTHGRDLIDKLNAALKKLHSYDKAVRRK